MTNIRYGFLISFLLLQNFSFFSVVLACRIDVTTQTDKDSNKIIKNVVVETCQNSNCLMRANFFKNDFIGPTSDQLWENVQLVHLTNMIKNHTIVPGASKRVEVSQKVLSSLEKVENKTAPFHIVKSSDQKSVFIIDINNVLPRKRITSHWHVYEAVHDKFGTSNWDGNKIAIIEKAKHFKGQLYGGSNRDFMVIGPHLLSNESYIIAPQSLERMIMNENRDYKGNYWFYEDSEFKNARDAVDYFNEKNKTDFPESWTIFSEKSPETDGGRRALLIDLMTFGKCGEPITDAVITNLKSIFENGQFEKMFSREINSNGIMQPSICDLFFKDRYGVVDSYMISFNGKLKVAKNFFSAWLNNDKIYWTMHFYDFLPMEEKITKLFKHLDVQITNAKLEQYDWKIPAGNKPSASESKALISELRKDIKKIEERLNHLSNESRSYFKNFKDHIECLIKQIYEIN